MNERIRELADEAGYTKDMFGFGHWDMPECQKFAELLIFECVKIAVFNGNHATAIAIKEHFGVEK